MDLIGKLNDDGTGIKYFLLLVDHFSKYVEIFPTETGSAQEVVDKLLQIFGRWIKPKIIITDAGSIFDNKLVRKFLTSHKIEYRPAAVRHQEANGQVESIYKHLETSGEKCICGLE